MRWPVLVDHYSLARIQSAQGWVVVRCRLTSSQQPGCLFVPMHWNRQFCNMANVDQLVAPHTCPFAGQPESKQTAVRIQRYDCDWQGLVLARQPLTLGDDVWWSRVPYGAVTAYWLAGSGAARDWFATLATHAHWRYQQAQTPEVLHRLGWGDGALQIAFYAARGAQPVIDIPAVVAAFSDAPAPEDRLALLAGQQASGEAAGRTICSCYGVGERQIAQAIDEGCGTVEALGKRLRCGTNCGSCIPELKQLLARQPA